VLAEIGAIKVPPHNIAQTDLAHGFILLPRILGKNAATYQYELWATSTEPWLEKLRALKITEISAETLEALRILETQPKYGQDIRDRDLPQETAQTHALHFAKGCYLGQEIVERIRSRGQVHRIFTPFRLTGTLPELPAPLEANGKPAGEITSAVQIGDDILALGYARREALDTHQPLTYPGGEARPSPLATTH
jgi:folate-binding protein YgfZ